MDKIKVNEANTRAQITEYNLGLSQTRAGIVLFGYTKKQAYDTWTQWENGTKKPSAPTSAFFDVILLLADARKAKTVGADKALELLVNELSKR